jgi:hypothetical protein
LSKILNFDVIHPSSSTQPFTSRFDERQDAMQTGDFVKCLFIVLESLENDGFPVASITSDRCSFQRKGLSWSDPASIQRSRPEIQEAKICKYSRLLFVPCVCHALRDCIKTLCFSKQHIADVNQTFKRLIIQSRRAALSLRRARICLKLARQCPIYCETRWIYDCPVVRFLCDLFDLVSDLLCGPSLEADMDGRSLHRPMRVNSMSLTLSGFW